MSYLEELKKESQERQKQEKAKTQQAQDQKIQRTKYFHTKVKPALEQLQRALRELTKHLNYLKPDTRAIYQIKGYGEIDDFQQQDYRVSLFDNILGTSTSKANNDNFNDTHSNFILRFFCETEYKYRLIKDTLSTANLQKNFFTQNDIVFDYNEEADKEQHFTRSIFLFKPKIQVLFEFVGNFETSSIDFTATNFDELGNKKVYTLQPDEINQSFLDELAKYILREPNKLILRETKSSQLQNIRKSPKSPIPGNKATRKNSPSSTFVDKLSTAQTKPKKISETKSEKKGLFGLFKKK